MVAADIAILAIVMLSVAVSIFRGFVREALSLLVWLGALWVAVTYTNQVDASLAKLVVSPPIRLVVAFGLLFLAVLIVGNLIIRLISHIVHLSGLSGTDRILGMVFGTVRGVLIVAVMVLVAGMTTIPQEKWWKESTLVVHFKGVAHWLVEMLPEDHSAKKIFSVSMASQR